MNDPRIICTVGMRRSGTSAITRGLLALGVPLGDRLMPANPSNAKGYFEDLDIVALNESILKRIGSEWYSTGKVDESLLTSRALASERRAAVQLLNAKLAGRSLFGLKDPRLAVLLPFWRGVFAELGLEDCYVIPIRSPLEVMKSLQSREGIPPPRGMALWVRHMLSALRHTEDRTRVFVPYAGMLDSPLTELNRIAEQLDLEPLVATSPEFVEYTQIFLDREMRHEKSSERQLQTSNEIPDTVRHLYEGLQLVSASVGIPASAQSKFRKASRWLESISTLLSHLDDTQEIFDEAIAAREAHMGEQAAAHAQEIELLQSAFQRELRSRTDAIDLERAASIALVQKVDSIAAAREQERQVCVETSHRLEASLAEHTKRVQELDASLECERLLNMRVISSAMDSSAENAFRVKQLEGDKDVVLRRLEQLEKERDGAAHEYSVLLSDLQAKHMEAESALIEERIRHEAAEEISRERFRTADAIATTHSLQVWALEAQALVREATIAGLELKVLNQRSDLASTEERNNAFAVQLASLQGVLAIQSQVIAGLQNQADSARADVAALRASHSWRITAPLRALSSFVRPRT